MNLDKNNIIQEMEKLEYENKKEARTQKIVQQLRASMDYTHVLKDFLEDTPIYYDRNKIWWLWNHDENKWEMTDETDMLNMIRKALDIPGIAKGKIRTEIIESMRLIARENMPEEPPIEWIQFKNYIYDLKTQKAFKPSSKYFFTNPIGWNLGTNEETPIIDQLFTDWVGEENKILLYEIIAYCLYRDYPIHRIFCLIGTGRNGKSKFFGIINKFIGQENKTTAELDMLANPNNRFESSKMYKKLCCILGETNFNDLKNTGLLKKLCGQDPISYEFKNKNPFDDINYAKILIATNNLPVTHDKTEGFYRRWLVIDFANKFKEGKDILGMIPDEEYENLAYKCINLLKVLLDKGGFTKEPSIEEKKEIYEHKSNPFTSFMKDKCEINPNYEIPLFDLYDNYIDYLKEKGYREISKRAFSAHLREDGFDIEKKHTVKDGKDTTWNFVVGIRTIPISTDTKDTQITTSSSIGKLIQPSISLVSESIGIEDSIQKGILLNIDILRNLDIFSYTSLQKTYSFNDNQFDSYVKTLLESGEFFESPKGTYRRL